MQRIGLKDYKFENASIREILDYCLKGTDLTYEIRDKHIIIHRDYQKNGPEEMVVIRGKVVNKKVWIQFLEQNPLKGTQLVFDRKWLSFVHYYQVTTIPRYILLDKEGKVVHLDMPRPSNPEFEKILKSLKGL